jgi:hypothetical protein
MKGVFTFLRLSSITDGEMNFKSVRARLGKHTLSQVNIDRHHLVIALERDKELTITDRLLISFIDQQDSARVLSLASAGQQ